MRTASSLLSALAYCALAALCVVAFWELGPQYSEFHIPQYGIDSIDMRELAFLAWYATWGTAAALLLTFALARAGAGEWLAARARRVLAQPFRVAGVAAAAITLGALAFRHFVLLHQPVADDESTYLFEAQTLLHFRVKNPLPPAPWLWQNQFVILNEHGWYGKYPIGHPLLLALGEALNAPALVMPVVAGLSALLTFAIGRQVFDGKRAALAVCLLALSPQFVWTHGTVLSQPTAALMMLAGMWALLRGDDEGKLRFTALAGLGFGLLVLARPMPGGPMAAMAVLHVVIESVRKKQGFAALVRRLAVFAPGLVLGAGAVGLTNYLQTGNPMTSGYETFHHEYGVLSSSRGGIPGSFGSALLRQNFWVLGWTASLLFVPFARPRRGSFLLASMVVADYAYRILVPKAIVATTGPIYVFEIVPVLVLATADGLVRADALLRRAVQETPRAWIPAFALASTLVGCAIFVPVQASAAYRSSKLRAWVFEELERRHAKRAVVFAEQIAHYSKQETWAYYPPNPHPDFSDDLLFARKRGEPGAPRAAFEVWRESFPDRRAFVYGDENGEPILEELDAASPPAPGISLNQLAWFHRAADAARKPPRRHRRAPQ